LILRSRVEDETLRAKYAAVVGIVGYADVPLVHYSVKLWSRGIHPVLDKSAGDSGMHPDMLTAFQVCLITFFLLFVLVFIQRLRLETLSDEVERLKIHR
jgi:heme exporter protein C